jgi:tight adherence protein C
VVIAVLALGWAFVVVSAVDSFASRMRARARVGSRPARRRAGSVRVERSLRLPGVVGRVAADIVLRRRRIQTNARVLAQLPVVIDLLAVAIGAGHSPLHALELTARHVPDPSSSLLSRVGRAQSLGESAVESIGRLVGEGRNLGRLHDVLRASLDGGPVIESLDRLAAEERAALRRRAEARARTVPVRLLFPLVFLVLPAFGLITVVPAIEAGLRGM